MRKSMHLPAVLPLHTCHTQLMSTNKSDQNDAHSFLGKDLAISQSAAQRLCKSLFSFEWFDIAWGSIFFLEICFDLSLLWEKSWRISPFVGCGVEEEGGLDDGGDGLGDEGEEEGGVGGRPGGETSQKPGGSPKQSHSSPPPTLTLKFSL